MKKFLVGLIVGLLSIYFGVVVKATPIFFKFEGEHHFLSGNSDSYLDLKDIYLENGILTETKLDDISQNYYRNYYSNDFQDDDTQTRIMFSPLVIFKTFKDYDAQCSKLF